MATPTYTTRRPQQITTTIYDQKSRVQTTSLQKPMQATGIKSDSSFLKTSTPLASAAARITRTNGPIMLQTPVPTTNLDRTGEHNEKENGSTTSAALSPVSVTLIAVCISILVVVSITLVAVCLLYRRRYRDKRKRPAAVQEDTHHAQDSYPLEMLCKCYNCEKNGV